MDMEITKADNGFIVKTNKSTKVAKTLEELMDLLLMRFEGRASNFHGDSYGAVIVLRCKCFQMNQEGLTRSDSVAGCSKCSERLAILA